MTERTPRLGLPLLASGQAQKEVTHNEALLIADAMAQLIVEAVAPPAIPASPQPGQCWIVGAGAGGAWLGHDHAIACWTGGGWRFIESREGMQGWSLADALPVLRTSDGWVTGRIDAASVRIGGNPVLGARQPAIGGVSGGAVVDAEARTAIGAIAEALRAHGLIAA